jgi:Phage Terminase
MRSSVRSPAPPRFATRRSPERETLGDACARVGAILGAPPLAWQRLVMDTALELEADGRPAYREVRVTVPRQQGKTGGLLLPVIVHRALGGVDPRPQRILYTAQDRNHAREKWAEHVELLDRSPLRRLYTVRRSNGSEAIRWRTGSVHGVTASGEKSGHGFTLDLGVIDEAFAQTDDRLEQAFRPAMVTRPWAQLWVVSTAGTDESTFLRERVEDGRARVEAGQTSGVAYFEWSAPDDAAVDDPATWAAAMPALGELIDVETVRADLEAMDEGEFARAYLNRWRPGGTPVFSLADWVGCLDPSSNASGALAFGVDVSPDRGHASVAVAGGRNDGRVHLELVERRAGTDWLPARIGELLERHNPVAVTLDPSGPAGSLVTDLTRLPRVPPLVLVTGRQYAQSCGALFDDVATRRIAHRGQPALDDAVIAARRRSAGDAWQWARPAQGTDPSPLIAATLARWGWANAPQLSPTIY